jgi:SAM-dependent methyltransferase
MMRVLTPAQGYALWAQAYDETAVTALESAAVASLDVPLAGRRVLDAGCGNGRRLVYAREAGASVAVGVDLTPEMLAQAHPVIPSGARSQAHPVIPSGARSQAHPVIPSGARSAESRNRDRPDRGASAAQCPRNDGVAIPRLASLARNDSLLLAAGDVRALPVADAAFDVVWCRLVLGHVADLDIAYAELGRSCAAGGVVVVTDFHPIAVEAGHRRTFRDARGEVHEVENHLHPADAHYLAAARAGLSLRERRDCAVDDSVRSFYADAGRLDMYERQRGLPLVLVLVFERAE